ncbi:MAG: hypothetical protein ABFS02_14255 [Pseudomonadota bacterium]
MKPRFPNDRLLGILNRHDELTKNSKEWSHARELADKRLPAYKRLLALMNHASDLDAAKDLKPQIDAIAANRSLLDATDPVPDLTNVLADALRTALMQAEKHYVEIYDKEIQRLEASESWQKIDLTDHDRILGGLHIAKVSKGVTGTEPEVLESLERISLNAWRTRTAALPQFFADARIQADKLVEPKTHHVKLGSATLHTPEEVKAWIEKTEQELLEQLKHGPLVVN